VSGIVSGAYKVLAIAPMSLWLKFFICGSEDGRFSCVENEE
jgi:hypothetical protein